MFSWLGSQLHQSNGSLFGAKRPEKGQQEQSQKRQYLSDSLDRKRHLFASVARKEGKVGHVHAEPRRLMQDRMRLDGLNIESGGFQLLFLSCASHVRVIFVVITFVVPPPTDPVAICVRGT